jgi:uncharacterized protein YbcI
MRQNPINKPTRGQLERSLSQQIQKLYREELGHSTGKIVCQLRDDQLTIIIESSLTQPEQLLLQECEPKRVEQLRSDLDNAVRPKLIALVEERLQREVVDLMSDTTLETGRSGFVVVLSEESSTVASDEQPLKVGQV